MRKCRGSAKKDGRGVRNREARREKRSGVVREKGRPGKGSGGGTGKARARMWAGGETGRPLRLSHLRGKSEREDQRGPGQRGAPRYLQRSSRTLPGISTRLVSMMRTHSRSSASRLRAAGDRGYGTESRLQRRRLQRGREGEGARPAYLCSAPSALDPRGWAKARGGAPGVTPRSA